MTRATLIVATVVGSLFASAAAIAQTGPTSPPGPLAMKPIRVATSAKPEIVSAGGVFGWAVFAPMTGILTGALAGEYVGASGDIGLGIAGANVLTGGSARSVALQPVSLEGSAAVDVALGASALKLRPVL